MENLLPESQWSDGIPPEPHSVGGVAGYIDHTGLFVVSGAGPAFGPASRRWYAPGGVVTGAIAFPAFANPPAMAAQIATHEVSGEFAAQRAEAQVAEADRLERVAREREAREREAYIAELRRLSDAQSGTDSRLREVWTSQVDGFTATADGGFETHHRLVRAGRDLRSPPRHHSLCRCSNCMRTKRESVFECVICYRDEMPNAQVRSFSLLLWSKSPVADSSALLLHRPRASTSARATAAARPS